MRAVLLALALCAVAVEAQAQYPTYYNPWQSQQQVNQALGWSYYSMYQQQPQRYEVRVQPGIASPYYYSPQPYRQQYYNYYCRPQRYYYYYGY